VWSNLRLFNLGEAKPPNFHVLDAKELNISMPFRRAVEK